MNAIKIMLITVWALSLQVAAVQAQSFSLKTYKLTVSGSSSLHDWESTVDKAEMTGSFIIEKNTLADISNVIVKIPVKAIKSTKGKMMDNKTWDAFDYEKNPLITFSLNTKTINPAKNTLTARGSLTMAGTTKSVDLNLTYKVLPGGDLQVTGSHKLKMSDYNMEAPTAMMGTIKVGEEVLISFDVILSQNNSHTL